MVSEAKLLDILIENSPAGNKLRQKWLAEGIKEGEKRGEKRGIQKGRLLERQKIFGKTAGKKRTAARAV